MDTINRLITEVWLKIFFKYLGRRHPQILITLLLDLDLTKRQIQIMCLRYISRLSWDEVVVKVNYEKRNVMLLHKDCINKYISL